MSMGSPILAPAPNQVGDQNNSAIREHKNKRAALPQDSFHRLNEITTCKWFLLVVNIAASAGNLAIAVSHALAEVVRVHLMVKGEYQFHILQLDEV